MKRFSVIFFLIMSTFFFSCTQEYLFNVEYVRYLHKTPEQRYWSQSYNIILKKLNPKQHKVEPAKYYVYTIKYVKVNPPKILFFELYKQPVGLYATAKKIDLRSIRCNQNFLNMQKVGEPLKSLSTTAQNYENAFKKVKEEIEFVNNLAMSYGAMMSARISSK
jgi:hypothetical protein